MSTPEHEHPMNIARSRDEGERTVPPPVAPLSEQESWELLEQARFARLATRDGEEIDITPLNIVADGEHIYFRSAPGTKVRALQRNPHVSIEIDRVSGSEAHSVVARGTARTLTDPDDIAHVERLGLRPWLETEKSEVVEITATRVTGRKFRLGH